MKAIINGKRYDTDKAEYLGVAESHAYRNDFRWWREELYKTKNGAFFISGEGNALSSYSTPVGSNGHAGSREIRPLDRADAMAWAEKHGMTELLESEFSDQVEDA